MTQPSIPQKKSTPPFNPFVKPADTPTAGVGSFLLLQRIKRLRGTP